MTNFGITAIVNAHREGLLAVPTLKSVEQAVGVARKNGITVDVITVLDRPDTITSDLICAWANANNNFSVSSVEFGDLGLSRNHGVSLASGHWIAFLDADDLWSANWLMAAFQAAREEIRLSAWHPEVNLYFGQRPHIFTHIDMDDFRFDISALAETNLWTALCFTSQSLLRNVPYRATMHQQQIGYEDWGWNMDTIAHGAVHKIVEGTSHAVRTKNISLVSQTTAAGCLPHPTNLFRSILVERENKHTVPHQLPPFVP